MKQQHQGIPRPSPKPSPNERSDIIDLIFPYLTVNLSFLTENVA
jgi:hypothetical protein